MCQLYFYVAIILKQCIGFEIPHKTVVVLVLCNPVKAPWTDHCNVLMVCDGSETSELFVRFQGLPL